MPECCIDLMKTLSIPVLPDQLRVLVSVTALKDVDLSLRGMR